MPRKLLRPSRPRPNGAGAGVVDRRQIHRRLADRPPPNAAAGARGAHRVMGAWRDHQGGTQAAASCPSPSASAGPVAESCAERGACAGARSGAWWIAAHGPVCVHPWPGGRDRRAGNILHFLVMISQSGQALGLGDYPSVANLILAEN